MDVLDLKWNRFHFVIRVQLVATIASRPVHRKVLVLVKDPSASGSLV